jgi:hypothetical protein
MSNVLYWNRVLHKCRNRFEVCNGPAALQATLTWGADRNGVLLRDDSQWCASSIRPSERTFGAKLSLDWCETCSAIVLAQFSGRLALSLGKCKNSAPQIWCPSTYSHRTWHVWYVLKDTDNAKADHARYDHVVYSAYEWNIRFFFIFFLGTTIRINGSANFNVLCV